MDHKHNITLKIYMMMVNFAVNAVTFIDERLWASLSNTPAFFETAGWADGSISKSWKKHKIKIKIKNKIFVNKFYLDISLIYGCKTERHCGNVIC